MMICFSYSCGPWIHSRRAIRDPLASAGATTSDVRVAEFTEVLEFSVETQITQIFVGAS